MSTYSPGRLKELVVSVRTEIKKGSLYRLNPKERRFFMNEGYIYVLINPSMEDVVKIGKTERDPKNRAAELSSVSGVPEKFIVVYQEFFEDCTVAEIYIHEQLEAKGYRISKNREFFEAPINEIIKIIYQAPGKKSSHAEIDGSDGYDLLDSDDNEQKKPWEDILAKAHEFWWGSGAEFEDHVKALELYKKAARLGSVEACSLIGHLYQHGEGIEPDDNLALKYFKEAAMLGDWKSYMDIMRIYLIGIRNKANAEKALNMYMKAAADNVFNRDFFEQNKNTCFHEVDSFLRNFSAFSHWAEMECLEIPDITLDMETKDTIIFILNEFIKDLKYNKNSNLYKSHKNSVESNIDKGFGQSLRDHEKEVEIFLNALPKNNKFNNEEVKPKKTGSEQFKANEQKNTIASSSFSFKKFLQLFK